MGCDPSLAGGLADLGAVRWWACGSAKMRRCRRLASSHGRPSLGRQPAGRVFVADTVYQGRLFVVRTLPWRGNVRLRVRPRVRGAARVGARVVPSAGSWVGGWPAESDGLGLEACPTRSSTRGCVMVSGGQQGCPGVGTAAAVIAQRFTGWYLFALDQRLDAGDVCAAVAYGREAEIPAGSIGPTIVRSFPAGPIVGSTPHGHNVHPSDLPLARGSRMDQEPVRLSSRASHPGLTGDARRGVRPHGARDGAALLAWRSGSVSRVVRASLRGPSRGCPR